MSNGLKLTKSHPSIPAAGVSSRLDPNRQIDNFGKLTAALSAPTGPPASFMSLNPTTITIPALANYVASLPTSTASNPLKPLGMATSGSNAYSSIFNNAQFFNPPSGPGLGNQSSSNANAKTATLSSSSESVPNGGETFAITATQTGSEFIIDVGAANSFTNAGNVDISQAVNAEIDAAPAGDNIEIILHPGSYGVSGSILLPSNTSIEGDEATLVYLPSPSNTISNSSLIANADGRIVGQTTYLTLNNGTQTSISNIPSAVYITGARIDYNISIQGITFQISDAHIFGSWFVNATDIDVQDNTYISGVDGNAFVDVTNSVVANNISVGQDCAGYDDWDGPTNVTIFDNAAFSYGTADSGWSVLLNGTPSGNPSNPGNAVNDGVIDNVFSSNWVYATGIGAEALEAYGFTVEANITEQGNIYSSLETPDASGFGGVSPITNLIEEDNTVSGIVDTSGGSYAALGANVFGGTGTNVASAIITGNLVVGAFTADNNPVVTNTGNNPATTNNAVLGANSSGTGYFETTSENGTATSAGNISNYGTVVFGNGVAPSVDIIAPATLFAPDNSPIPVSGLAIEDLDRGATISVTLLTHFGSLSMPSGDPGVEYTTIGGETAIILTGTLAEVNTDLGQVTFQSNAEGWDDTIEMILSDSAGGSATRYLPVITSNANAAFNSIVTLTPGEVLPEDPNQVVSTFPGQTLPSAPTLSNDTVLAATGNNVVSMSSTISIAIFGTGNNTIFGGSASGYIATGAGNALLNLDEGGDITVAGGAGGLHINAATGDNLIQAGASNAFVSTGSGTNSIIGGLGDLTVQGGSGDLYIATLPQDGGVLDVTLGSGNSTVFALSGTGIISTETGTSNLIFLGLGHERLVSSGNDMIVLGAGSDTINATRGGSDSILGGTGSIYFSAGSGTSFIDPSTNSTIIAGAGDLTVGINGSFVLDLPSLVGTNRIIRLPDLSDGVTVQGFDIDAIKSEFIYNLTASVSLDDGTTLLINDPSHEVISASGGTLGFVHGTDLGAIYYINADDLAGINQDGGVNNAAIIEQAISAAPAGSLVAIFSDMTSPSGLIVDGTLTLDPVDMTVAGAMTGKGLVEIESGTRLELDGSVSSGETIAFAGTGANLALGQPGSFLGTISGIATNDFIDLATLSFSNGGTAFLAAGNILDVVENGITTSIQLDRRENFAGDVFHLFSDGLDGTTVTEGTVPCFLKGTKVRTPHGEVAVENLKIGDRVINSKGDAKPIIWIGRRAYRTPAPMSPDVIPVLIKANAIDENIPDSDLYLSPLHAIEIAGVLVPVGGLVNDVSIITCSNMKRIEYIHLHTEQHDVVLAHNTPSETFIDLDSIKMFDNAEEFFRLYPHASMSSDWLYAPRVEFGPELERIRRKIALRAGVLLEHPAASEFIGYLEYADRSKIVGWAYSPQQPNVPQIMYIYINGCLNAKILANILRPDVRRAGYGDGRCGFSITLPAPLPALQRHEISVRPARAAGFLTGSPQIIDPGVTHDLLYTGGLGNLLDAAVKGAKSHIELNMLGQALECAARNIQSATSKADFLGASARTPATLTKTRTVLVIDNAWPTVDHDAGSNAVMSHILAFLELGCAVAFCASSGSPKSASEQAGFMTLRALGVACHGEDGKPPEVVIRGLDLASVHIVYVHRLATASSYIALVRQHLRAAKVIYSIADLHHLRILRQGAVMDRPDLVLKAKSIKAAEFFAIQLADCIITHSSYEATYLREELPFANVHVITWNVEAAHRPPQKAESKDIAFIGPASHPPNHDAVLYLAHEIMPKVWERDSSLRCLIVGADWASNMFKSFDPRMVNVGHQPSLKTFLKQVRLTVAPMRFGAGIKGKVIESMASGTPCIMSEIAAEGLPLTSDLRSIVGNGNDLVENILRVYNDKALYRSLGRSGLKMIKEHFSQETVTNEIAWAIGRRQTEWNLPATKRDRIKDVLPDRH
jgi:glycosyltransferase involved in cell wall biosynthesis